MQPQATVELAELPAREIDLAWQRLATVAALQSPVQPGEQMPLSIAGGRHNRHDRHNLFYNPMGKGLEVISRARPREEVVTVVPTI